MEDSQLLVLPDCVKERRKGRVVDIGLRFNLGIVLDVARVRSVIGTAAIAHLRP